MVHTTRKFITKSKFILASAVFALAFSVVGATTVLQAQPVNAQASQECDDWNIVRCGLTGTTLSGYISSFKSLYTSGTDNGNNDLKTVYQWAGATDANVAAMSTNNTKLGTLYKNGEIKVDGKVVGTNAWVTGRYSSEREGFEHVTTNVYARATTNPSYTHDTATVIVHYGADGAADYAIMTNCGNSVKFTPTPPPPPPAPEVSCDLLTVKAVSPSTSLRNYSFKVQASAKNTKITGYTFHFGDNTEKTVTTSATTASTTHVYGEDDTTYSGYVGVNTTDQSGVTSDKCRFVIKTPKVETPTVLACTSLTFKHVKGEPLAYRFTAKANAKNVPVITYTFHFGDDTMKVVKSDALSAEAMHTYAENNQTYVAFVTVSDGNSDAPGLSANACKVTIKTPKVDECKPGVPIGSPECEEETPIPPTPEVPTTPEEPTELPAAGAAGVVGLFGATTALGTLLHRFILRRRLGL